MLLIACKLNLVSQGEREKRKVNGGEKAIPAGSCWGSQPWQRQESKFRSCCSIFIITYKWKFRPLWLQYLAVIYYCYVSNTIPDLDFNNPSLSSAYFLIAILFLFQKFLSVFLQVQSSLSITLSFVGQLFIVSPCCSIGHTATSMLCDCAHHQPSVAVQTSPKLQAIEAIA